MQFKDTTGTPIEIGDYLAYTPKDGGMAFYRVVKFHNSRLGVVHARHTNGVLSADMNSRSTTIYYERDSLIVPENLNLLSDRQYRAGFGKQNART